MRAHIALLFQSDDALGVYQAGVFDAIEQMGIAPLRILGTSLGAINAALIAGNVPERCLERLYQFWTRLSYTYNWNRSNSAHAVPRALSRSDLRALIEDLVDIELLARPKIQLTLGTIDSTHGGLMYIDSETTKISLDHVLQCWHTENHVDIRSDDSKMRDTFCLGITSISVVDWIMKSRLPEPMLFLLPHMEIYSRGIRFSPSYKIDARYPFVPTPYQEVDWLRRQVAMRENGLPTPNVHTATRPVDTHITDALDGVRHLIRLHVRKLGNDTDQTDTRSAWLTKVLSAWVAGKRDTLHALEQRAWAKQLPGSRRLLLHDISGSTIE
jgi:hypothetical protein